MRLEAIAIRERPDGLPEIGDAPPVIGVTLGLLAKRDPRFLSVRDGIVVFSGVDAGGQPREVAYRAVGFQAGGAGDEGGYVVCERAG